MHSLGDGLFPGKHYLAKFNVKESEGNYHIDYTSSDNTSIAIDAKEAKEFSPDSIFNTLENASDFFEKGTDGYSPNGDKFEGMKLHAYKWGVKPLEVLSVKSSFFEHEWNTLANKHKAVNVSRDNV